MSEVAFGKGERDATVAARSAEETRFDGVTFGGIFGPPRGRNPVMRHPSRRRDGHNALRSRDGAARRTPDTRDMAYPVISPPNRGSSVDDDTDLHLVASVLQAVDLPRLPALWKTWRVAWKAGRPHSATFPQVSHRTWKSLARFPQPLGKRFAFPTAPQPRRRRATSEYPCLMMATAGKGNEVLTMLREIPPLAALGRDDGCVGGVGCARSG